MKMFRNILNSSARRLASMAGIAIALYACSALSSCSDDSGIIPTPEDKEGCFITVTVPMQDAGSRADGDNNDRYKEFTVKTLDLFFYKAEGFTPESSQAVYHKRIDVDFVGSSVVQVNILKKEMDVIFGTNGTKCVLYAVANYPKDLNGSNATPNQLQNLTVGPNFEKTNVQKSFAMISDEAEVTLDRTEKKATGKLTLTRACAKLMLSLDVPASIDVTNTVSNPGDNTTSETTVTYVPNLGAARVWISNGVKESNIFKEINNSTKIDKTNYYTNTFNTDEGNGSSFDTVATESRYKYVQSIPFYSYPNKWDPKSAEGATIIIFQIPWKIKDTENSQILTYYSITVNPDSCQLLRNNFYDMRVIVSRLGSSDISAPVDMEVEWNYELPWNKHTLPINIKDIRYLLLNNNDYDSTNKYSEVGSVKVDTVTSTDWLTKSTGWYVYKMNNETEISIPVSTSHKVKISKVEMIWRDYAANEDIVYVPVYSENGNTGKSYTSTGKYIDGTDYLGVDFDNSKSTLNFKRGLYNIKPNSTPSQSTSTYTPMYVNVYICHEDDPTYAQKIRIEQYPPIYISSQKTSYASHRFINKNNTSSNDNKGFVSNSSNNSLHLGSLSEKANHNTYIINISRLDNTDTNKDYVIADPRTQTVNNFPYLSNNTEGDWTISSNSLETNGSLSTTTRLMTNYYPSSSDSTQKNYIAPQFRIASQYGVTVTLNNLTKAQRRCASYQENGRPAGRWRLPTIAEIKFIANLSATKHIPYLFGDSNETDVRYWCASGAVTVNNKDREVSESKNENNHVRCVYDEWYWGNDTLKADDKAKFVWGDRPRSTSGNVNKIIKR